VGVVLQRAAAMTLLMCTLAAASWLRSGQLLLAMGEPWGG
jgi:hypothetical protein